MSVATKFITTTSAKLSSIPVTNGQVIALSDRAAWFYDMEGSRHAVVGANIVTTNLPEQGVADTLYILSDANNSGVYIWKDTSFQKVAELSKEYTTFTGASDDGAGTAGLVPAPSADATNKFLKGDGTWGNPVNTEYADMSGADGSSPGASGLVPAPEATDNNKFLKGDGTWDTPHDTTYEDMKGASSSADGASGLVPKPTQGADDRFLASDGTWKQVETTDTKNTAGATASDEKLYIVGAAEQSANPETHTNSKAYVTGGKLYSNGVEVANLSDEQAFTNKTYEGYTLGNAVTKSIASSIADSDEGLPTAKQVYAELQKVLGDAKSYTDGAVADVVQFNIEVVDSLPEQDIKDHTIYLVPSTKADEKNIKTEYLYVNGAWEMIGSTAVDLTGYVKEEQMTAAISEAIAKVDTGLSVVDGKLCITYESE